MPHIKEEQLSAYLDKQLDPVEGSLVEAHLLECESCRSLYEEMSELTHLFQRAERLEPSPFLWTRIAAGFEEHRESARKRGWISSVLAGTRRFAWKPGIAAAALGIMLFVGIAIFKQPYIDPAALVAIDEAGLRIARENPDTFNPFGSRFPMDVNVNPFSGASSGGKTTSAQPKSLLH